jgi:hypothetical protein
MPAARISPGQLHGEAGFRVWAGFHATALETRNHGSFGKRHANGARPHLNSITASPPP